MAANILTFKGIYERIRDQSAPQSPGADQTTEAKQLANDGYLKFLSDHDWTFIAKTATVTLWPTTQTGAVTAGGEGNKTLTVAVDTFYASMVGRTIVADTSGNSYTIVGYTDAKTITVTADASADDGDTFTITTTGIYVLPDDFAATLDDPVVMDNISQPRLKRRPEEWIRERIYRSSEMPGWPRYYDVIPREFVAATGQRWDLLVWPYPSGLYPSLVKYRFEADAMSNDTDYPLGGGQHSLTIVEAGLTIWEHHKGDMDGNHATLYEKIYLPRSVARDNRNRPKIHGATPSDSDVVERDPGTATYLGH